MKRFAPGLLRPLVACTVAVLITLTAGCGDSGTGTVKGKITVNGKPLPSGLITFLSEVGNKDAFSASIVNGEYESSEIPVGAAKIIVIPSLSTIDSTQQQEMDKGDVNPVARPPRRGTRAVGVPEKYQNPETSGLEITIKKGANEFSQDLTEE